MIRWKALSLPNFFQSKKAEVFLFDPPRMRISKINAIKSASRFEATWHLKVMNQWGRSWWDMLLIATVGIVYSDLFVRVPHHVPCILALLPRAAPDPQVIDPGRNTSNCGDVFILINASIPSWTRIWYTNSEVKHLPSNSYLPRGWQLSLRAAPWPPWSRS